MKCAECQFENPEGAEFCRQCSDVLGIACAECGRVNPADSRFCNACGRDLRTIGPAPSVDYSQPQSYTPRFLADKILNTRSSIEGERKLVTVLFADVAEFTTMSEKLDPEEVHQVINGCFHILMDEIHGYEGTINQFTGDGVMALFGAPVAHEDHAQRACYAALSIQKAIGEHEEKIRKEYGAEFKMRIGLNSGQVIVGSIGDDLRMDYTAVGDTTNLAARMESMARPGAVWVSRNTHKLSRDFFEFRSLGKIEVKGKETPQEAYELGRAKEVGTRIQAAVAKGLTKFVGRGREMEALRKAFDRARTGASQVVGLTGDAGVGKSRVLLEFRNTLPRGEHTYLEGSCLHYGGSVVYWPILDILKSCFGIREGDREQSALQRIQDRLSELDETLLGGLPPLRDVLSLPVQDQAYLKLEPQQRRQRIFKAVRDLLIRLSQEKPLVLAIEDLHWIDTTSKDFLDFFAEALTDAPILLILLYRPERGHAQASRAYVSEILLDQLSTQVSAELVQAILEGGNLAPELRELIISMAGGNPLFVEELTASLLENGSIRRKEDQYILDRKASEIEVPDTIHGIIAARMDRLEESLKRIMQVASVIGREFAYRILAKITGRREELKTSLLQLQDLEFIYEKQLFTELQFIFKHALTQEVAYNSLLRKRRREIHEEVGKAVEQVYTERLEEHYELLAYHYSHSDNKEKTLKYLDLANQKAAKTNAMEDAKAYFDQAMGVLDTLPETEENQERRISLLANQSTVFYTLLKMHEYYDLLTQYEPMVASLGNPGLRGKFYVRLGVNESLRGHFDQAIQTLTKGSKLLEAAGDAEETGIACGHLATCHCMRDDHDRVFQLKEDYLRTMEASFDIRSYVRLLGVVGQSNAQLGRWNEAVDSGQKALHAAQGCSDNSLISVAASLLSAVYTYKRDLDLALKYAELALEKAPTRTDKVMAELFLTWPLCHAGETRRGIEALVGIIPIFKAVRMVWLELWGTFFLADGYWLAGEHTKGRETAEELLAIAEGCGARYCIGYAHFLLGEISLETDPAQAATLFEKSIAVFQEIKAESVLAMAYAGFGRLHKQQGNIGLAREYLTKALEIFERLGTLIEPDKVRKALAELPQ